MDRTRTVARAERGVLLPPIVQAMFKLAEWNRRRQIRKAYGPISDVLLRDVGLTADDLASALEQPLGKDASDALLRSAMARTGNW